MPHPASSLPPSKRHSRLTIVRRGCKRSRLAGIHGEAMYTAPTLRSACSHSSYRLPMCGVKGRRPLRSLGGPRGPLFSRERIAPFPVSPTGVGKMFHHLQVVNQRPQHCLYFFPLPQGQGSLRPIFLTLRGCFFTVPSPDGGGDDAVGHALALDLAPRS